MCWEYTRTELPILHGWQVWSGHEGTLQLPSCTVGNCPGRIESGAPLCPGRRRTHERARIHGGAVAWQHTERLLRDGRLESVCRARACRRGLVWEELLPGLWGRRLVPCPVP